MPVPEICIIVPFFQERSGLLKRSVMSVLRQDFPGELQVIVVDDASPMPASAELSELQYDPDRVRLLTQDNAGAGAARNLGLQHVPKGTRYVAFLDSDDEYTEGFLPDAVLALRSGVDLFFGNSVRFGKEGTRFDWNEGGRYGLTSPRQHHQAIDEERVLFEFKGDFFDLLVHSSNLISTSTLVYSFSRYPDLRFNTGLFNGQDRLFKLHLGQCVDRVGFTPRVCATEGEGVNIFDKAQWGSDKSLRLLSSYIELPKEVTRSLTLDTRQRRFVASQLRANRESFVATLLHMLVRRQSVNWGMVARTVRRDPALLLVMPWVVADGISKKLFSRSADHERP